jgi:hypothetical protein
VKNSKTAGETKKNEENSKRYFASLLNHKNNLLINGGSKKAKATITIGDDKITFETKHENVVQLFSAKNPSFFPLVIFKNSKYEG